MKKEICELEARVNITLNVANDTAQACLALVEMYVRDYSAILGEEYPAVKEACNKLDEAIMMITGRRAACESGITINPS